MDSEDIKLLMYIGFSMVTIYLLSVASIICFN